MCLFKSILVFEVLHSVVIQRCYSVLNFVRGTDGQKTYGVRITANGNLNNKILRREERQCSNCISQMNVCDIHFALVWSNWCSWVMRDCNRNTMALAECCATSIISFISGNRRVGRRTVTEVKEY